MDSAISQFAGRYYEWAPPAELRAHVRCFWINDLSRSRGKSLRIVPDGCVDIVYTGEALSLAGPDTRPILAHLRGAPVIVGVRFHPGVAPAWIGHPLSALLNCRLPLREIWHDDASRLLDRAATGRGGTQLAADLEACLRARLRTIELPDPRIAILRRAAGDNCTPAGLRLDQLASHLGWSQRTLRRRCIDAFGYGFKTLERVFRFQRFFRLASQPGSGNLTEMAAHAGYADQAHLAREARLMSGMMAREVVAQVRAGVADSFKPA